MVPVEMSRLRTEYNKPIYIGFSVLQLSIWKMYNFHYDYMKTKNLENINLCCMDTNSFIYDVRTIDKNNMIYILVCISGMIFEMIFQDISLYLLRQKKIFIISP